MCLHKSQLHWWILIHITRFYQTLKNHFTHSFTHLVLTYSSNSKQLHSSPLKGSNSSATNINKFSMRNLTAYLKNYKTTYLFVSSLYFPILQEKSTMSSSISLHWLKCFWYLAWALSSAILSWSSLSRFTCSAYSIFAKFASSCNQHHQNKGLFSVRYNPKGWHHWKCLSYPAKRNPA